MTHFERKVRVGGASLGALALAANDPLSKTKPHHFHAALLARLQLRFLEPDRRAEVAIWNREAFLEDLLDPRLVVAIEDEPTIIGSKRESVRGDALVGMLAIESCPWLFFPSFDLQPG